MKSPTILLLFILITFPAFTQGLPQTEPIDSSVMVDRVMIAESDSSFGAGDEAGLVHLPIPFDGYHPDRTSVRWDHAVIMGTISAGVITGIHLYQQNAWWRDRRTAFHFVDDSEYTLNVDKAGHFNAGAFSSFLFNKSLEWSGVSHSASVHYGSLLGLLFQTYVEFEDGFAQDWGFSLGDQYANMIGAAWPIAQYHIPFMRHLHPKFTYWPSKTYRDGKHHGNAIDDYEGQTYWLGVHVHGLLPETWKEYWPDWLGIAVGIAGRGKVENGAYTQRNILIALDYDMTKIIPGDSWLLHTLKQAMNFLHYPSPAIRISPGFVSYGIYFQ